MSTEVVGLGRTVDGCEFPVGGKVSDRNCSESSEWWSAVAAGGWSDPLVLESGRSIQGGRSAEHSLTL